MKFNAKIISLILIAITISNITCSFLKKKPTAKNRESSIPDPANPLNLQLPAYYQLDNAKYGADKVKLVTQKAQEQSTAAINLLTNPNKLSKDILTTIAGKIKLMYAGLQESTKVNKSFQRSIYGGAWQGSRRQTTELMDKAHWEDIEKMLNEIKQTSGLQLYNEVKADIDAFHREVASHQQKKIDLVATGNGAPIDRCGIMGICGDIGTALFDCDPTKDPNSVYCQIKKKALESVQDAVDRNCFDTEYIKLAKATRGGSAIAPKKKPTRDASGNEIPNTAERGDYKDPVTKKNKSGYRSGLLSTTAPNNQPFKAIWPWQMIPGAYMDNCVEPWAGHYSGSIVEVLYMMDYFTKEESEHPMRSWNKFVNSIQNPVCQQKLLSANPAIPAAQLQQKVQERRCKAALAASFLISLGYHSAIEIKPTIWMYLEQTPPSIFTMASTTAQCDITATQDIVTLMRECTAAPGPKGKKKKF